MSAKLRINTRVRRLIHYIEDIEKGVIQIPAFQRDFVWKTNDKLELFDSIKRGYPIGSVLFWRPEVESFDSVLKIGPYTIPPKSADYFYILDGFQRLSTIFGCLTNPDRTTLVLDRDEWEKKYQICYDLETEEFFIPRSERIETFQVRIHKLIDTRSSFNFQRDLSRTGYDEQTIELYMDRYEKLGTTLIDYNLPSIDILGGEIDEAVEIFSRVNSKGADISPDWMVSALTYNRDRDFRLGTIIDQLIEELRLYNFEKIKRELVLQCIINSFGKAFFDQSKTIEVLAKRDDFISTTLGTIESIKKAIKFLFEELLVLESKLLPYNNQLIFITDFFNSIVDPSDEQLDELKRWFWITTYSSYFTIYSLSKQREAYNHFQKFLRNETKNAVYNDRPDIPFIVVEFPNKIYFGSVRAKALILFLLNHSNGFGNVDSKDILGFDLSYLFFDIKDEKGNFLPESVVPIMNRIEFRYPKSRDVSFMLEDYDEEMYGKYLLTRDMSDKFRSNSSPDKVGILSLRKELIMSLERDYVVSLGIEYEV
jgi:hypothetical protein